MPINLDEIREVIRARVGATVADSIKLNVDEEASTLSVTGTADSYYERQVAVRIALSRCNGYTVNDRVQVPPQQ